MLHTRDGKSLRLVGPVTGLPGLVAALAEDGVPNSRKSADDFNSDVFAQPGVEGVEVQGPGFHERDEEVVCLDIVDREADAVEA